MQTNKQVTVSQYLKLGYTSKSRDSVIRMLKNGLLPENVVKAEMVGLTYVLTLKSK